jgi:hypothetical protein
VWLKASGLNHCGIRFRVYNYAFHVGAINDRLFPLLESQLWCSFEEIGESKVDFKILSDIIGCCSFRLPCLIEHYDSIEADDFKPIVERSNRHVFSALRWPLLMAILRTREKEGGGSLLNWIIRQNDDSFLSLLLSKHPLNLGDNRVVIPTRSRPSRPGCFRHISVSHMRKAMLQEDVPLLATLLNMDEINDSFPQRQPGGASGEGFTSCWPLLQAQESLALMPKGKTLAQYANSGLVSLTRAPDKSCRLVGLRSETDLSWRSSLLTRCRLSLCFSEKIFWFAAPR